MTPSRNRVKEGAQHPAGVGLIGAEASKRPRYRMRLFVAGDEPNSVLARRNIDQICSEHLDADFKLELIDVFEDFAAAVEENILVAPALVVDEPRKIRIFGTLKNRKKVLAALNLT